jgi:hypothetical protein
MPDEATAERYRLACQELAAAAEAGAICIRRGRTRRAPR